MGRARPSLREQVAPAIQGVVLALVVGPAERARIQGALRGKYTVRFIDAASALEAQAGTLERLSAMIVESHDVQGTSTAKSVAFVRAKQPELPIVGYCRAGIAHSSDVRALAVAGVHELLFHGIDDSGTALREILALARQATVGEIAAAALLPLVPTRLAPFVRYVTANPAEAQRVARIARALGHHRRTLVNLCAQADLPGPQELTAWCRLAVIGYLLGTSKATIEAISLDLDFPSDTALRNLVKRYVGVRASDVRSGGGLPVVVAAFERAIIARRLARQALG